MKKRMKRLLMVLIMLIVIISIGYVRKNQKQPASYLKAPEDLLLAKSKLITANFLNGNDIIRKYSTYEKCDFTSSCIAISNPKSGWLGTTDDRYPLSLSKKNLLFIRFKNSNEAAGLSLIGQYAKAGNPWWKDKVNLDMAVYNGTLNIFV